VNLLEDITSGSNSTQNTQEETAFSGLEVRSKNPSSNANKPTNGFNFVKGKNIEESTTPQPNIANTNGFNFVKGKKVTEENDQNHRNHSTHHNKELLNIFGNNDDTVEDNKSTLSQPETNTKQGGFSFIKNNGKSNTNVTKKDDLTSVFQDLNIVTKSGENEKQVKPSDTYSQTLQDTLNNKLDLDKLYKENNNNQNSHMNHFNMPHNVPQNHQNNHQNYPPQFYNNNNVNVNQNMNHNISNYHQNYNLNVADFNNQTNNLRIGENYIPLDINDYNKQQQLNKEKASTPVETKKEKDHFDFVNDLFKKKSKDNK